MNKLSQSLSLKKRRPGKKIVLVLLAIAVLALGVAAALAYNKMNSSTNSTPSTPTADQDRYSNTGLPGSDYNTGKSTSTHTDSTDHNHDPNSDSTPPSKSPSIEINSILESNGVINIATLLSNVRGDGKCVFTFSRTGEKTVTKEATSVDKSCSIEAKSTEFSKLDIWTLNIAFYQKSVKITDKTINVTIN